MKPEQIPTQELLSNAGFALDIVITDSDNAAQDVTTWTFQAGGWLPDGNSIALALTATASDPTAGTVRISAELAAVSALFSTGDEKVKTIRYTVLANVPDLPVPAFVGYGILKFERAPSLWT